MSAPTIHVTYDLDSAAYILMATSHGHTAIAGPRILRAPPHPDVAWSHETKEQAEAAAKLLQQYLDGLGKGPSKQKLREQGE